MLNDAQVRCFRGKWIVAAPSIEPQMFDTNAEAWRFVDRYTVGDRQEAIHDRVRNAVTDCN